MKSIRKHAFIKKFFAVCLILVLTFGVSTSASAATKEITVSDDFGFSIELPWSYIAITQSSSSMGEDLKAFNCYLLSYDLSSDCIVSIEVKATSLLDYSTLSNEALTVVLNGVTASSKYNNLTVLDSKVFEYNNMKYLKLYYYDDESDYCVTYNTISNGYSFYFKAYNGTTMFSTQKLTEIENIVNSICLHSSITDDLAATIYTDSKTGLSFTIPDNWKEEPLTQQREIFNVKFANGFNYIGYGSVDLWDSYLSETEKKYYTRNDFDNAYNVADIMSIFGEILGIPSDGSMRTETYAGKEYYIFVVPANINIAGFEMFKNITCAYRYKNGCSYQFFFAGDSNNDSYYKDFEALLSSVIYPNE